MGHFERSPPWRFSLRERPGGINIGADNRRSRSGADASLRIRLAPECDLLHSLVDATSDGSHSPLEYLEQAGQRRSLIRAPGLVHARQALVQDTTYDWSQTQPPEDVRWHYALIFRDPTKNQATHLLFDLDHGWVQDADQGKSVAAAHCDGLRHYFDEQMAKP